MNICIVTVYNSVNSGSFLQAYALGETLKKMGHNVYYYKRPHNSGSSSSALVQIKNTLKYLAIGKFTDAKLYLHSIFDFRELTKRFTVITSSSKNYNDMDCFVLGSDTIWNLRSRFFSDNRAIYWGMNFRGFKTITYAGSVGNTTYEECERMQGISDAVLSWNHIGVRDKNTFDVISRFTRNPVYCVCDPTFLLSEDDYCNLLDNSKMTVCKNAYVFLYLFNPLSDKQTEELVLFCKQNELKIVNGTKRIFAPYADEIVVNSPRHFLEGMLHARYVITDTYHGTAFAINFRKNFVSINRNINKVNELLFDLKLSEHLASQNVSITDCFVRPIQFDRINDTIEEKRLSSLKYLKNSIDE